MKNNLDECVLSMGPLIRVCAEDTEIHQDEELSRQLWKEITGLFSLFIDRFISKF